MTTISDCLVYANFTNARLQQMVSTLIKIVDLLTRGQYQTSQTTLASWLTWLYTKAHQMVGAVRNASSLIYERLSSIIPATCF